MEIVGRLSNDAVVKQLKDDRKVVLFSIAINDFYKQKGTNKGIQIVLYINCAYWISANISEKLSKGSIVELNGRLHVNAYTGLDGEAKASLNCHVNSLKLHYSSKQLSVKATGDSEPVKDDLPF